MSWTALLALAAGAYALKAVGPVVVGNRQLPTDVTQALELLSVPLVAALVAVQTLDGGGKLVLDARVPALAVAAVLVAIGYRVFRSADSPAATDTTAMLPKGARILSTAVAGDRLVITVDSNGATEILTYDARTLKPAGRLKFATEP